MGGGGAYIGLDVGTQSTKAVLFDPEGQRVIARSQVSYGLIEGLPPGAMEQHPSTWTDAVERSIAGVLAAPAAVGVCVRGIGVSGQQHGAVLVDRSLEPVRAAKLWCDTETAQEAAQLSRALGRVIPAGFTAPKLRFVADREPDVWERTASVLLPHDYINAWLTGERFTELGDASGTGYLDPVSGAYDEGAVALVAPDLERRLPKLVPCDRVAATVLPSVAERLGLAGDVVVSAGGGDNMMSAIGSGATRPGVVTCSLGTSGTVFGFAARPLLDEQGAIAAFRASSVTEEGVAGHLPLLCVMNCTGPLESLCGLTGLDHDQLTERAGERPPGNGGLLLVPFLVGERTPNLPNARGVLSGIGADDLDAGALYRAALEGVALNLGSGLDRMRALGAHAEEVRLVGGAAGNPLWREILATVFGVPVRALAEQETAAVGAAIQVACAHRGESMDEVATALALAGAVSTEPVHDWADAVTAQRSRFDRAVEGLE